MRLMLASLLPGSDYVVEVRADDGVEKSLWSPTFNITTIEDTAQPLTPSNVTWETKGDAFYAEWDSIVVNANNDYSLVTKYEVELTANGVSTIVSVLQQPESRSNFTLDFNANEVFFGEASPTVAFRVRSVDNKNLKSDWSDSLTATMPAPLPVTELYADSRTDSISLRWLAPASGKISKYQVYVSGTQSFTPSAANRVYDGTATTFTYSTTTYLQHFFVVRSVNAFGQESPDATVSQIPSSPFVVDTEAPATPTGLSASIVNNTNGLGATGSVTWNLSTPPNDLGGFYIRYRKVGTTNYSSVTFEKDARTGNIELQSAFANYEFQIRAYDWSANESPWSPTTTAISPANTAPNQVVGLTSVAGRDSIRYSWTPSTALDLKEYEFTISTTSGFTSGTNIVFKTGTSAILNIGGLTPNTSYYSRVRAVDTGNLSGSFSATNTTQTLGQLTPEDIGAPTNSEFDNLFGKVDESIKEYVAQYSVSSSETTAPTTGWSDATPTRTPGTFIWTRTLLTYHDNTTSTTSPALLTGPAGSDGAERYTWIKYSANSDGTGMVDTPTASTTYIGIAYNKTTQTESSVKTDYQWSLIRGSQGDIGPNGVGVSSVTPFFRTVATGSAAPAAPTVLTPVSPWTMTEPVYIPGTDLYRTDRVLYTNSTFSYSTVTKVSAYTAATMAMDTANGKNKITFSVSDPSGTNHSNGDVWFKRTAGVITNQWEFATSTNTWQPRTLSDSTISSLNVGKLVSGTISATDITLGTGGIIQSSNYDSSSSGFRLSSNAISVKGAPFTVSNVESLQADLDKKASEVYVQSRGADVITNGTGAMGNNTNFSAFDFQTNDAPIGAAGSFVSKYGGQGIGIIDEFLPVNPSKTFKFSFQIKQKGSSTTARAYGLAQPFDAYKNSIAPYHYGYQAGTTTTLAQTLNPGDTTIVLSGTGGNWYTSTTTHLRSIIWWDYVDEGGKAWGPHTYSRNWSGHDYYASISGNTITLRAPYDGPVRPAGTQLSNGVSGSSYIYTDPQNFIVSNEWTEYSDTITGTSTSGLNASFPRGWPPGTGYAKVGWLLNRMNNPDSLMAVALASMSDASAANDAAGEAFTRWAPTNQTTIDGGNITTDTLDAIKIKAGTTFTQDLQVASKFTVGTAASSGFIQSHNYSSTAGWRLDKSGLVINNGSIKASALVGDTLGSSTGVINVGLGASIVMNGGFIKSNTNTGTTLASAEASNAGFFLNNDGLFIGGGSRIKASALISDTLTSTVITLGSGGRVVGGSGWELNSSGLNIPDGAVSASKLAIRSGNNIVPNAYANFEDTNYSGRLATSSGLSWYIDKTTPAKFSTQSISTYWNASQTVNQAIYMAPSTSEYNISVEEGVSYIFSVFAWCLGSVDTSVSIRVRWNNGVSTNASSFITLPANSNVSNAVRLSGSLVVPAGVTACQVFLQSNTLVANGSFNFDGLQVEQQFGNSPVPTPWSPPGVSLIDGGIIRTGEIRSTGNATVNGVSEPIWSIPLSGAATFTAMRVLGNTVLGNASTDSVSRLSSYNYVPGSAGWSISADGDSELNDITARGMIYATGGTITGNLNIISGGYININSGFIRGNGSTAASITEATAGTAAQQAGYYIGSDGIYIGPGGRIVADALDGGSISAATLTLANSTAQITTASGNSFWKGDDTAQFYKVLLTSNVDANGLPGNQPALRVGTANGPHLRIDGNEIISMANDNTYGLMGINMHGQGEGSVAFGSPISAYQGIDVFDNPIKNVSEVRSSGRIRLNPANGQCDVWGGDNLHCKMTPQFADTAAVVWKQGFVAITADYFDGTTNASNTRALECNRVRAYDSYLNYSDGRAKENIIEFDGETAISLAKRVPIKSYFKKESMERRQELGVVAQDLLEVLPNAVQMMNPDEPESQYGVSYQDIWALGFAATKKLINKVENLEEAGRVLREQIAAKNQEIEAMKSFAQNMNQRLKVLEGAV